MIRLDLLSVGQVEQTNAILLVLRAAELARLLVIETGPLEGTAVVLEAEGVKAERPLTHDLLHTVIEALGARVREVRIESFYDETFYAKVVLSRAVDGTATVEVDSRPSDAIALALRAGAPIYVADEVLAEVGVPEEAERDRLAGLYEDEEEEGRGVVH